MGIQYKKVHSASKQLHTKGPKLQRLVAETLGTCANLVGSTLGPGGQVVVIEHQDPGMAPIVTKDGVTVFRNIGFRDPAQQIVMEAARSAAVRTAAEAGDGTSTATILASAILEETQRYCSKNPSVSPQLVVRKIQKLLKDEIEPFLEEEKILVDFDSSKSKRVLQKVAEISGNGDIDLAKAVMDCFEYSGPEGNVTLTEANGTSKYLVEKIDGYPIPVGYEESCGAFYQKFVNDPGTQTCQLERPSVVLHHGRINDFNSIFPVLAQIANHVSTGVEIDGYRLTHNVIVVATGFSESVLANLAAGFVQEGTLNIYPLTAPMSPVKTGQYDFLADLAALTGANILDPIERPLQNFTIQDLGLGPSLFEATRFRSNLIGHRYEELVVERVDQIQKQLSESASSELEKTLLRERVAKLTSGIARLIIQGPSAGEIKERRDRAEDAVAAVRGAIRYGVLPGGGKILMKLSHKFLQFPKETVEHSLGVALRRPVSVLLENAGFSVISDELIEVMNKIATDSRIFNVLTKEWVEVGSENTVYDSLPAVREALRNSISIATLLGTCGGIIAFERDHDLDRKEAQETAEWLRSANTE